MSDSTCGMTDLDMDDMEMIMQQLQYEQLLQEQEAESSNHRNYIYRECDLVGESLMADILTRHPFRSQLGLCIVLRLRDNNLLILLRLWQLRSSLFLRFFWIHLMRAWGPLSHGSFFLVLSLLRSLLTYLLHRRWAATIALPTGILELDTHSSSESGPSEGSLPHVPIAPMVLPFLYLNDSESDAEWPERHDHDAMVARWRSRVASRPSSPSGSSSPTTSTLEIPTAPILPTRPTSVAPSTNIISPIVAPPGVCRRRAILIRPGQDIPVGRFYRTYIGGPCRALTARKMVGPLPSHRLALRYTSHHFDHFTSGSSSDHSSSDSSSSDHFTADHSLSGHSTSYQTLSRHTSPVTTIADSSTPSRFIYPPLTKTLRGSKAYRRWRSPAATVPLPIPAPGTLVPTRVDLLPPCKRFRDSYSSGDSVAEDIDADVLADIEADVAAVETVATMDVEARIDACISIEVNVGVDREYEAESSARDTVEIRMDKVIKPIAADDISKPTSEDYLDLVSADRSIEVMQMGLDVSMQELYDHMHEIPVNRITDIEIMTITRSGMTPESIEELINQRVAEALATYEANHATGLFVESQSQNRDDGDNGNGRGNGDENGRGNGNENGGGNGNGNPN
ncbi:hypothetical protein Tco_0989225 [Tanacetum coccineum]|uniref:Uncharacterized protein n=1 Tax=Tanacetum coccineum TaxID=301880 RepID=A0ABQ5ET20_9ASTR